MNALSGCVASLTLSTETLQSTIEVMDLAVADYPRLSKVLSSHRHFELIAQSDIQTAQSLLSSTIQPETERLVRETEKHLHRLQLKERKLIAESELLETRIANSFKKGPSSSQVTRPAVVAPPKDNNVANAEKLKKLKAQKQRLAYAVERLELEKRQKEMQLKKSMSYNR
ncbi:hypothetical protein ABW20_dc0106829 [Dactylellina cionopaga]|nr:hypothetical protein ABW20_dc0106829 [Dactylellina cionopaga]